MTNGTTIALISGGIDSATAAAIAQEKGEKVIGLSFNYGQRHQKELQAASELAKHLGLIGMEDVTGPLIGMINICRKTYCIP